MTELKTLKDLIETEIGYINLNYDRVKQEAIKWVKADKFNDPYVADKTDYGADVDTFIRHFFNITEEDLK